MSDDDVKVDISTAGRMAAALEVIAEHVSHPLQAVPRGAPMEPHFDVPVAGSIRLQAQTGEYQWKKDSYYQRDVYNLVGPCGNVVASVVRPW